MARVVLKWLVLLTVSLIAAGLMKPAIADDTEKGTVVVTGSDSKGGDLTDSDVYVDEFVGTDRNGKEIWKPVGKKHVGPSDKGEAKIGGLTPGKKYRVIGRKQDDDMGITNANRFQVFVFQPNSKDKKMAVKILIKMKGGR